MSAHNDCSLGTAEAKSEKTHILWATNMDDDGYADIMFLVGDKSPYGVGINCGGHVIVKPLRDWHALGAAQASWEWQPFSTAPKDGTPILCFHPDDEFAAITGVDLIWWEPGLKIWTGDGDNSLPFLVKPTHWRPLPTPPMSSTQQTSSDGGGKAVGVPAQMQESSDRGLAQDAEKPEDTTRGNRPARSVTCSPSVTIDVAAEARLLVLVEKAMDEWEHDREAPDTGSCAHHIAISIAAALGIPQEVRK